MENCSHFFLSTLHTGTTISFQVGNIFGTISTYLIEKSRIPHQSNLKVRNNRGDDVPKRRDADNRFTCSSNRLTDDHRMIVGQYRRSAARTTTIGYRLPQRTVYGIHLADKQVTGNSLPDIFNGHPLWRVQYEAHLQLASSGYSR